ncbi:hypothetical protein [uncultured Gimesia sp.]|uniref:beta strand repeat-containing protein n=1 Tax=uncultured Gimesia sp. TaxID=1678688 RepID=UPI0030DB8E35|tara:strand:- start:39073 stop:42312 length:3240 start_codon:yes stop_codon:yes gene_type:complete
MRITNWLNAFTSRLHFRPRYNSRARRAMRRRMHQRSYLNPPAVIELLEVRQMLTSTLFLDFGAGFTGSELHTTVEDYLEIDGTGTGDGTGPDLDGYGFGSSFLGLTDDLVFKSLDYDFDGNATVNTADLTALANAVVPLIERALEPFDIDVVIASASDFSDVQTTLGLNDLDASGEFDAYVFVTEIWSTVFGTGGSLGSVGDTLGLYGIAAASDLLTNSSSTYHQGNQYDEAAHTFVDEVFADTTGTSGTAAFNANLSQRLAYTATHEAFHTFSAIHTTDALDAGDVIELGSATREDPFMVTRFDLDRQYGVSVTTKNNYDLLATDSDIGLRDDDSDGTPNLAYVTGTGGHDQITLTDAGLGNVSVTINAYSDAARTTLIGTDSYTIDLSSDTEGEILIDAGIGDDEIIIDASIEASFRVRGNIGDDTLIIDVSDGLAASLGDIAFDAEGDGGSILLDQGTNVGTFTTIAHTLSSNTAGSISVDGQTITYTNTTSITDELETTSRTFSYTGASETVTLSDYGASADGLSSIYSTQGAAVTFASTGAAITVSTNSGSGADTVNIEGLDSLDLGSLTVTGDTDDEVRFQTNDTVLGTSDLTVTAQTITVVSNVSSTSGVISLTASRNIFLANNSSLTTVDGGITLLANNGGGTTGQFAGVKSNNTTIATTGSGDISITGYGANGTGDNNYGINLVSSTISSSSTSVDAGTITINGTGGVGTQWTSGLRFNNSTLSSIEGDVTLIGEGGSGSQSESDGVILGNTSVTIVNANLDIDGQAGGTSGSSTNFGFTMKTGSQITSTGTGAITISGTGGSGTSTNRGIHIYNSGIESSSGDIELSGQGGTGSSSNNFGLYLQVATITSTGTGVDAASITLDGTGGSGTNSTRGLVMNEGVVTSIDGDISLTGQGGSGTTTENHGVNLLNSEVTATGTAAITIDGTGGSSGTSSNRGIFTYQTDITSVSGDISLEGHRGGNSNSNNNQAIVLQGSSIITTASGAGTGDIYLEGAGDILLTGLSSLGHVRVETTSGSILDNGDTDLDIVADSGTLIATGSIGLSGNLLDTSMGSYTAVSGISDVNIYNI